MQTESKALKRISSAQLSGALRAEISQIIANHCFRAIDYLQFLCFISSSIVGLPNTLLHLLLIKRALMAPMFRCYLLADTRVNRLGCHGNDKHLRSLCYPNLTLTIMCFSNRFIHSSLYCNSKEITNEANIHSRPLIFFFISRQKNVVRTSHFDKKGAIFSVKADELNSER